MTTEVLVLGSIQTAILIAIGFYVFYTSSLAKETQILAKATQEAYLNPQVLLQIKPYGRTGALNLVLENIGRGVAKEVHFSFPKGLLAPREGQPVDLTRYSVFSNGLSTLVPGEQLVVFLGLPGGFKKLNIPTKFPYEIHYLTGADQPKSISGVLDLEVYSQGLVPAYTNIEDLRKELEEIRKAVSTGLQALEKRLKGENEEARPSSRDH